jgi:DNA polymerase III subunit delta'
VIDLPDQPMAQRVLRAALEKEQPPQQLLLYGPPGTGKRETAKRIAWALVDPGGDHNPDDVALDITVVSGTGAVIRLDTELDPALADIHTRPMVGKRRVLIIDGCERLSEQTGAAARILKVLEEPPPLSHLILVTDRPGDILPTIRSRCLPVPFRSPGWRAIAARLEEEGLPKGEAEALARSDGPQALTAGPFARRMRGIGARLGLQALLGVGLGSEIVATAQAEMESVGRDHPSEELVRLRAEADEKAGKRGERTAQKRVTDQEKRELRRAVSDGWSHALEGASGVVADALAIVVGAEGTVRHQDMVDDLRQVAVPARREFLERAAEEIQATRSELQLNPTMDLAIEALLARIHRARRGTADRLTPAGRLPY